MRIYFSIVWFLVFAILLICAGIQFGAVIRADSMLCEIQQKQTAMQDQITNIEKWTKPEWGRTK